MGARQDGRPFYSSLQPTRPSKDGRHFFNSKSYKSEISRLSNRSSFHLKISFMKLTFLPKLFVLSVAALISFCSLKDPDQKLPDPTTQVKFEVVDSLIVNVLEDLTILDYQESTDRYLMKQLRGGKVVVTDGKGNVISSHEIAGEGPNQVPNVWEGRFFGPDGYIFKEMSATMDFHVYNADFQKTEKIKGPAVGL